MSKFELTVAGKSARFICREDEDFDTALSRGAKKLGWDGRAWRDTNYNANHTVTVTRRSSRGAARECANGICAAV